MKMPQSARSQIRVWASHCKQGQAAKQWDIIQNEKEERGIVGLHRSWWAD